MKDDDDAASAAAEHIRALNDDLRTTMRGGTVLVTSGITSQGEEFQRQVLALVRTFDAFDVENDPYQEHDFGSLLVEGLRVFFKIDYYDLSLDAASHDPADATVTQRVITIMLAEEY